MKYKKLLILVLIAILAGFGIFKAGNVAEKEIGQLRKTTDFKQEKKAELISIKLVIDKEQPIEKEVKVKPNGTVFDSLQKSGVQFEFEEYDSGIFITSIEGISNPTKSWMYYVNEKLGKKAVDKKQLNSGDVVKFKNQKPPF